MTNADTRRRRYVAVGGGHMALASTAERASTRLAEEAGRDVPNFNIYLVIGKDSTPLDFTLTQDGLMGWTAGAERILVWKVRMGGMCYIDPKGGA